MPIPASKLAPNRQRLLTFVSPNVADILFVETVDAQRVGSSIPAYGTPHPDSARWPHHELVLVKTADEQGLFYQYYYAAKREAQDDYNFEFEAGEQLFRTYLVPRDEYFARNAVEAADADPVVPNEFVVPVVTTPDIRFPKFGFADDTLARTETELDSTYVVVRRRYLEPVSFETIWDDELESDVLIERRIIAKDATLLPTSGDGVTVERKDVNVFHDLLTISRIGVITWTGGTPSVAAHTYPRELPSVPSDASYPFPLLLRSASIEAAWAFADSAEAAYAYDEAWYFAYDIVEPAPGPYETRIRRFIATDPNELSTSFTIDTPPATQRETIGIGRAWAYASNKGNSAFAEAREEVIPPSIHDVVEIDLNGLKALSKGLSRTTLPASEGFAQFAAKRSMVIGYEPRKTRYGLYEIRVIELNCTGVYSGRKVPLGAIDGDGGSTGAGIPASSLRPEAPTATINADNTIVSGKTYPAAQITITDPAANIVGRDTADEFGDYNVTLTATYVTAVALTVTVRYNSATSFPTVVNTRGLTPGAPLVALSADRVTLTGRTDPGATVSITSPPVAQVERVTVSMVGVNITTAGVASIAFDSALTGPLALSATMTLGDGATDAAYQFEGALSSNPTFATHFTAVQDGADVVITALVAADNDATLNFAYADDTCVGLTPTPTSADEVAGDADGIDVEVVAGGTGAFGYTFSPAVTVGTVLTITATGAGGTSPAVTITANASPPTISSAGFTDSTSIVGSATALSIVRAYLDGVELNNDAADGSGNFDIAVASLIRGETVRLVAELAGDATIKSATFSVTAPDLALEKPVLTYTSAGWIGTAPAGATAIVYRLAAGGPETVITPFANGNFTFNLPTYFGEQYSVVARYPAGDSDPVFINAQSIPREPMRLLSIALGPGNSSSYFNFIPLGYYSNMNGLIGVSKSGYSNWLVDSAQIGDDGVFVFVPFEAGVSVQFTFPGQALNTITHTPGAPNYGLDYRYELGVSPLTGMSASNLPTLMNVVATYTDGRTVSLAFDRANFRYKYVPAKI